MLFNNLCELNVIHYNCITSLTVYCVPSCLGFYQINTTWQNIYYLDIIYELQYPEKYLSDQLQH